MVQVHGSEEDWWVIAQQTQNICMTFVQRRPNVFDVVQMSYKCFVFTGNKHIEVMKTYWRQVLEGDIIMWGQIGDDVRLVDDDKQMGDGERLVWCEW